MKEGISFLSPVPYSPLLPSMTCFQCSVRRQRQCTAHYRANCLDTTRGFPTIRPHICRYLLTFSYRWYVDLEVSPTITNVIRFHPIPKIQNDSLLVFPQSLPHQDLLSRNVLGLAMRMFPPQRWYHPICG